MTHYIGLSILPDNQCEKPERRKLLSNEAWRILSRLEGRSSGEFETARDEQGRPFFPGRDLDFNIAHSGMLAAVSVVRGSNLRTGCDVELVRKRAESREISELFFSPADRDYIFSQGRFDETRFYEIWTLKECYLKLRGLSVFDMREAPSFVCERDPGREYFSPGITASAEPAASGLSFTLFELSGSSGERYILATALEGTPAAAVSADVQPELRWFSQSSLFCKSRAKIKAALKPADTVNPKM